MFCHHSREYSMSFCIHMLLIFFATLYIVCRPEEVCSVLFCDLLINISQLFGDFYEFRRKFLIKSFSQTRSQERLERSAGFYCQVRTVLPDLLTAPAGRSSISLLTENGCHPSDYIPMYLNRQNKVRLLSLTL